MPFPLHKAPFPIRLSVYGGLLTGGFFLSSLTAFTITPLLTTPPSLWYSLLHALCVVVVFTVYIVCCIWAIVYIKSIYTPHIYDWTIAPLCDSLTVNGIVGQETLCVDVPYCTERMPLVGAYVRLLSVSGPCVYRVVSRGFSAHDMRFELILKPKLV